MQMDTAKTMTHCKYCGKPYAHNSFVGSCRCGLTHLNKFDYHAIMERLDNIEALIKGGKQ